MLTKRPGRISLLSVQLLLMVSACGSGVENPKSTPSATAALTASSKPSTSECFSRRNGRIAWVESVSGGVGAIFSAEPDGTAVQQLTFPDPATVSDFHPDWSPDGSTIIFARAFFFGDVVGQLYRMNSDGSDLTQVGDCTGDCVGNDFPSYSPDGKKIAFIKWLLPVRPDGNVTSGGVWVMKADGTDLVQLTQIEIPTGTEDSHPRWSPDGKKLIFMRLNTVAAPLGRQAIFVANVDGSDIHRITPWHLDGNAPDWSPDGKVIVFSANNDSAIPGPQQLYTVHPNGSELRKLLPEGLKKPANGNGKFSPNGEKIVFQHQPSDTEPRVIYKMNADGSDVVRVTFTPDNVFAPVWGTHP